MKAGSLVLVFAFDGGVAIYDLDDEHAGAVTVQSHGQKFSLSPGESISIIHNSACTFDSINPAQNFAYRNIQNHELPDNARAFRAEFHIPTAIQTVSALKELVNSRHPKARHLLKTTAAMLQLRSTGGAYQQIPRPSLAAWSSLF
jgi:hypothetical protein